MWIRCGKFIVLPLLVGFLILGLYLINRVKPKSDEIIAIGMGVAVAFLLAFVFIFLTGSFCC